MARHLRRNHDYQTLIIPYLFLRTARTGSRGRAASLNVFAFSADGEKVLEGVAGSTSWTASTGTAN